MFPRTSLFLLSHTRSEKSELVPIPSRTHATPRPRSLRRATQHTVSNIVDTKAHFKAERQHFPHPISHAKPDPNPTLNAASARAIPLEPSDTTSDTSSETTSDTPSDATSDASSSTRPDAFLQSNVSRTPDPIPGAMPDPMPDSMPETTMDRRRGSWSNTRRVAELLATAGDGRDPPPPRRGYLPSPVVSRSSSSSASSS